MTKQATLSFIFAVYSLFVFEGTALVMLIIASLVYLASVFLVTMFGNVPMNDALARLDHDRLDARI
ncbi:hypothetical protein EH31_17040 [Erythrobacter longus]|uniref:Uncharacterized protein n=1 Tax=Erythrobacter longus TaxID=1044 RepID=A0A074M7I3_ERYLO|nr:DUF1772 domain-containing protein [Erythrobacter longus]KEO88660.1 hypothetical protein EH31_17040 [Erythrobacter longus]